MGERVVIGLRYCGGCNPRYDRVALAKEMAACFPQAELAALLGERFTTLELELTPERAAAGATRASPRVPRRRRRPPRWSSRKLAGAPLRPDLPRVEEIHREMNQMPLPRPGSLRPVRPRPG